MSQKKLNYEEPMAIIYTCEQQDIITLSLTQNGDITQTNGGTFDQLFPDWQ